MPESHAPHDAINRPLAANPRKSIGMKVRALRRLQRRSLKDVAVDAGCTGGTYLSEADLAAMIGDAVPGLVTEPGPAAWNEGHLGPLVIDAARRDLGYVPSVVMAEGLADLARDIARLRRAAKASGECA